MILPKHLTNPNLDIYKGSNYVTLDFETTNTLKGSALSPQNRIVLSVWDHGNAVTHDWSSVYHLDNLVRTCDDSDFLVAHNAKFELQWLAKCGIDLYNVVVWDTMIAEHVLGGNKYYPRDLGLDAVCKRRGLGGKLGIVSKWIKDGVCPSEIPRSLLLKYCKQDVRLTKQLFKIQLKEIQAAGLMPVMYTRCLLTPVLADIETNGINLDVTRVTRLHTEKEEEYARLTEELNAITGGVNFNSPKQLAGYLYEELGLAELRKFGKPIRTPTGKPKTDTDTIALLPARTLRQQRFLSKYTECSSVGSELSKYLRSFARCCAEAGGRLRANLHQCNTRTHRLASTGLEYSVQFHNQPRAYKYLFCASGDGRLVGETDSSQLEFRAAVHLGNDQVGLSDIVSGKDAHATSASMLSVPRQEAKKHTFKPLYGGKSGTDRERRYYKYFQDRYEGITNAQQGWIDAVLASPTNELVTEYGLRYYFLYIYLGLDWLSV